MSALIFDPVPEYNEFKLGDLALSEKQIPQVVGNIESQNREWSGGKPVSCFEGRRSIQLSYGRVVQ